MMGRKQKLKRSSMVKYKERMFSGKRKSEYLKMEKIGFELAMDFLDDMEYLFGGDRNSKEVRKSASNCAIGAPGVIMPKIHGPNRRKYFISGANSI